MKEATGTRAKAATILVIVYEYIVRDILTRILRTHGHNVVTCSVGSDGIRKFKKGKKKFDLIMIDVRLPGISGLDVAKIIKKISQKTPVILIKGREKELDTKKLKESGVNLIMRRPFYMDKTLELVENAI